MEQIEKQHFQKNFLWGSASAAYQIEGHMRKMEKE